MRTVVMIVCLLALGCSQPQAKEPKPPVKATAAAQATATASTAAAATSATPVGSDWPSFLGPTGDSKSSERGILTTWPKAGPKILWQMELGTGYGAPTVSQGRLFQLDRDVDSVRLRTVDRLTGKPIWEFTYPSDYQDLYGYDNGPRSSPIVDGDRVYALGAEGMLHCLRFSDGKVLWKINTTTEFGVIQNFFGVGTSPVIEKDLLIVMIGGSPPESQNAPPGRLDQVKGNGTGIVAFDKLTGKVRYKLSDELASYSTPVLATINGRRWCFAFAREGVLGFEPAIGKLDFHFPWRASILESVNASCPVVVGNQVFVSETYGPGGALIKVREGGYDEVWTDAQRRREKAMQTHWNTPIHIDGYLYGSSGRHETNAELRCIELATGNVKWSVPDLTRSSLMYADGHFFCLSEDGTLRLLKVNPEKYEPVAEVVLEGAAPRIPQADFGFGPPRLLKPPAWAAPILSHGLLYVRGRDRLVCLEVIPK